MPAAPSPYGAYPAAPPPYGYSASPPYAGFWVRLGGYLLDSLLYGLALSIFAIPAVVLGVAAFDGCVSIERADNTADIVCPAGKPDGGLLAAAIVLGLIGIVVVAVLYLRALGRTGQTWGRKIVGVKVVAKDTQQPLGIGKAFLRQIIEGIVGQACILSYLWMLWDKDKQTWHDKIVSSVVIRV
jgi:uncharacterized RDD family membrane protein YckC